MIARGTGDVKGGGGKREQATGNRQQAIGIAEVGCKLIHTKSTDPSLCSE
jgi:hypothetical protein